MTEILSPSEITNDMSFESLFAELKWRGLIHVSTDETELDNLLKKKSITFYCGFDPTAPSLHLGNLVQLIFMRRLQNAGHKPLALVGGSTGLIGDPRPSAERTLQSKEIVAEWVKKLQKQIEIFLSSKGDNPLRLVNNLEWTENLSAIDFLREIGKHYRVGTMLKKDAVSARLNSEAGISYTEFSYQILQGYDFLELYKNYDCVLQTGGSDQWGNLTSGIDLIHRTLGETAHAIGTPLITNSDGSKFGKSEGNAIWLDADLVSPFAFYQFWLNTDDADVVNRLKVFTFLKKAEIKKIGEKMLQEPHLREAQKRLAFEITAFVHGVETANECVKAAEALFGKGDLALVSKDVLLSAVNHLPFVKNISIGHSLLELFVDTGLCKSKSDARRSFQQGGIYLNHKQISDSEYIVHADDVMPGNIVILRRGRKALAVAYIEA